MQETVEVKTEIRPEFKPQINDTMILILTSDGLSPAIKKISHDKYLLVEEISEKI